MLYNAKLIRNRVVNDSNITRKTLSLICFINLHLAKLENNIIKASLYGDSRAYLTIPYNEEKQHFINALVEEIKNLQYYVNVEKQAKKRGDKYITCNVIMVYGF